MANDVSEADILGDITAAFAPQLAIDADQATAITQDLAARVRLNSAVPDTDPRLRQLLAKLPVFAKRLELSLDERTGLRVAAPPGDDIAVFLERGLTWLRGFDWQKIVTTRVSMETTTTLAPSNSPTSISSKP